MKTVSLHEAKNRFAALAREVERGETITVTRNGKPIFDIVPHRSRKGGLNWGALEAFKRKHSIEAIVGPIPEDFNDPLPEDFLIRPLPVPRK